MTRGSERLERIRDVLAERGVDALLCAAPSNVLLLSGYWPVLGTSLAIAGRDGRVAVIAPEDERDQAALGWQSSLVTYEPQSLHRLQTPLEALQGPLCGVLEDLGLLDGRLAVERHALYQPASYAGMYFFGAALPDLVTAAAPRAAVCSALDLLTPLRASLTPEEIGDVRRACAMTGVAFTEGASQLRAGMSEPEAVSVFEVAFRRQQDGVQPPAHAEAHFHLMSGPNSARAGGAFARTGRRRMQVGDLVLVHCNSHLNGYWTDVTRTYCLGAADQRAATIFQAIHEARKSALATLQPGMVARDVDTAAREVLRAYSLAEYFTHPLGHNVGFSAISGEFPPRLHPASPDVLAAGMTFNMEPAVYIPGFGGARHCDVVTMTAHGPEILTDFQSDPLRVVGPA